MLDQAPKHVNANSSFVSHLQYAVKSTSLEVHKKTNRKVQKQYKQLPVVQKKL